MRLRTALGGFQLCTGDFTREERGLGCRGEMPEAARLAPGSPPHSALLLLLPYASSEQDHSGALLISGDWPSGWHP